MNTYKGRTLATGKVPKNSAYVPVNVVSVENGVCDVVERRAVLTAQDLSADGQYASLEANGPLLLVNYARARRLTDALHRMRDLYPDTYASMTELSEDLDASELTDATGLFDGCAAMPSINVDDLDLGRPLSLGEVFRDCAALTSINVDDLDAGAAVDLHELFKGCVGLTTLDLHTLDTGSAEDVAGMFEGCANLRAVNLGDPLGVHVDTSAVEDAARLFRGCGLLADVDGEALDVTEVVDAEAVFEDCGALTTPPVTRLPAATDVDRLYAGCTGLPSSVELDIRAATSAEDLFTGSSVTSATLVTDSTTLRAQPASYLKADGDLSVVFKHTGSVQLTNAQYRMSDLYPSTYASMTAVPDLFNSTALTTGAQMFAGCATLGYIYYPRLLLDTSRMTSMDGMFQGCAALTTISPMVDARACTSAANMLTGTGVTQLSLLVAPNSPLKSRPATYFKANGDLTLQIATWILPGAEYRMSQLYPSTYASMTCVTDALAVAAGHTDLSDMFNGCTALKNYDSFHDANNVYQSRGLFASNSFIYGYPLSNESLSTVTTVARMFKNCAALSYNPLDSGTKFPAAVNIDELLRGCSGITHAVTLEVPVCTSAADVFTDSGVTEATFINAPAELRAKPVTYFKADGNLTITWTDVRHATHDARMADLYPQTFRTMTTLPESIKWATSDVVGFGMSFTSYAGVFRGCAALTNVSGASFVDAFPGNVAGMFAGCAALTDLTAPIYITKGTTCLDHMLDGCAALTSATLRVQNSFDESANGNSTFAMFRGCSSLTAAPTAIQDLVFVNTAQMFAGCLSLATVPTLDLGGVVSMWGMFRDCTSLPAVFPWTIDAKACVDMLDVFTGSSVTEVVIKNASAELKVKPATYFKADGNIAIRFTQDLTNARYRMSDLYPETYASMTAVPDLLNTEALTVADDMFAGCAALVSTPAMDTSAVTSMDNMFAGCAALATTPQLDMSSAISMDGLFAGCASLPTNVELDVHFHDALAGAFTGSSVTLVTINRSTAALRAKPATYLKADGQLAVTYPVRTLTDSSYKMSQPYPSTYSSMTELPEALDTSALTTMNMMFGSCGNLTSLPTFDLTDVTDIAMMFYSCRKLTSVNLTGTSGVTSAGTTFCDCSSLASITLDSNLANVTNFNSMFGNCSSLTTVPYINTAKAHMFGQEENPSYNMPDSGMFYGCTSLPAQFPWTIDVAGLWSLRIKDIFTGSSVTRVTIANASSALRAKPATYFKADGNITVTFV